MTQVAFLWHMHQPYYEDLVTGEHILPWVRLHALKDYYGMVALLKEFPSIRATFNLVPSLLTQLEAFAADRARDRHLDVGLKPAEALDEGDVAFALQNFFHAGRQHVIEPNPRYAELLDRRGSARMGEPGAGDRLARLFSADDLRDLQVWHKLAWIDPLYHDTDARVRALVAKGRAFTEADKAVLRGVELELLNAVIPAYRDAASRGQVELSTSPFYHPILPLLCDTDVYAARRPQPETPRYRFAHPEDALAQLVGAVACHERLFGHRPMGVWPSEGSVSNAMVPLVAQAGFAWMATDELILARSLGIPLTRDGNGLVNEPERLYKPYVVRVGEARAACTFRDHVLSDLIGFTYAHWPPDAAADDFVERLVRAGRHFAERAGGSEAVIPIILDGENAWEHFEGGGRPFLRALYGRLSGHPDLRTVTMAEACRGAVTELPGIFAGSWIDASFDIWIGHRDDQRAWRQLGDARDAIEAASPGVDASLVARARQEIEIAEGSDWFWWYGDDHSSEHDREFDDLFRRHLRNVYGLVGKAAPDELFASNISTGALAPPEVDPTALVSPTLDGEVTSYFEWLGAGHLEVRNVAGAMHEIDHRPPLVRVVYFGFDRERLFVRIDGRVPMLDLLAAGHEVSLKFLAPEGVRFSVTQSLGRLTGRFWRQPEPSSGWLESGPGHAVVAAGEVLELALPLTDLDVRGTELAFFVAVVDDDATEVERHPTEQPIRVSVPDAGFEAAHWSA